jgi:hypothetical protein
MLKRFGDPDALQRMGIEEFAILAIWIAAMPAFLKIVEELNEVLAA